MRIEVSKYQPYFPFYRMLHTQLPICLYSNSLFDIIVYLWYFSHMRCLTYFLTKAKAQTDRQNISNIIVIFISNLYTEVIFWNRVFLELILYCLSRLPFFLFMLTFHFNKARTSFAILNMLLLYWHWSVRLA